MFNTGCVLQMKFKTYFQYYDPQKNIFIELEVINSEIK